MNSNIEWGDKKASAAAYVESDTENKFCEKIRCLDEASACVYIEHADHAVNERE